MKKRGVKAQRIPAGYGVASLAERAEAVRDRRVDAAVDNMLKITNDGRKLAEVSIRPAADQRYAS